MGISTHYIENNHFLNPNNVKLLYNERKGKRLLPGTAGFKESNKR